MKGQSVLHVGGYATLGEGFDPNSIMAFCLKGRGITALKVVGISRRHPEPGAHDARIPTPVQTRKRFLESAPERAADQLLKRRRPSAKRSAAKWAILEVPGEAQPLVVPVSMLNPTATPAHALAS